MELISLTPKGRIAVTLVHGRHTYSELRFETGLSDRWLTAMLKELEGEGVIERKGKWYGLRGDLKVHPYELSFYMGLQARRMAEELAQLPFVRMIVLYGGVAKKNAHEYSDLDMILVVGERAEKTKEEILKKVLELESRYHLMIEPLILAEEDFLDNVYSREGGIIYGVAEGFEVLVDKTSGRLTQILHDRIREIRRTHEYLKEEYG